MNYLNDDDTRFDQVREEYNEWLDQFARTFQYESENTLPEPDVRCATDEEVDLYLDSISRARDMNDV